MTTNEKPFTLSEITDADFDLALHNAQERSDPHLHAPLLQTFRTNPRFIHRLLIEANERAAGLSADESARRAIEDAILEGAALVIAAQQQHATSSVPPITIVDTIADPSVVGEISTAA